MSSLPPLLLVLAVACGPKPPPTPAAAPEPVADLHPDAVRGVTDPALRQLLSDHWEWTLRTSPTWATRLGDHRYDDRLADLSEQAAAEHRRERDAFRERARMLESEGVHPNDALTLRLFAWELDDDAARDACRFEHWSVQPRGNRLTAINAIPEDLPVASIQDAANLLARYRAAPATVDQEIANLRIGLADGLVANAHSVGLVVEMLDTQLSQPDEEWPLYAPVEEERTWDREATVVWREDTKAAIGDIRTSFEHYRDFLRDEVLPAARPQDQTGLAALPVGEACYGALVHSYTTLDRSPDEVHQHGLDALQGIHREFVVLGDRLWGQKDLARIFEKLRNDPALYFETGEQVQDKAESALAAARDAMPEAFGRLPEADCVVEPIPDYQAPYTTIAYYQPPTPGERPGTYFVNTFLPETRPRHEAEVLAFHEAIPGHHLQIAISQELPDVPAFRRHGGFTAFVEGWALYTERLSDEMGLYTGDLDRMGMLSFDAWRASRLVVDTGIHHKGWSREQAVEFLVQNTPLAENNIDNEVDRYITWPGQAVAYKTGQTEIWALRRQAEADLGDGFDLKAFHDVVLGAGGVPLPVLRERVEGWIESSR